MNEPRLQIKDLTVSFRTGAGKVQAVRGISFDLYRGETLAIVGESGSGKSVTSRAILGILAANAVVEGGRILYDGQDLLKIDEEEFHRIRGDKIAMIFQDPMSSLNPIMRIGRQLTEAMLLKSRANRKESRRSYKTYIRALRLAIRNAGGQDPGQIFSRFESVVHKQSALQEPWEQACENARAAVQLCDEMLLGLSKQATDGCTSGCVELRTAALGSVNPYLIASKKTQLEVLARQLPQLAKQVHKSGGCDALISVLQQLKQILDGALQQPDPDFFALACGGDAAARQLEEQFLSASFVGVRWSAEQAGKHREEAIQVIQSLRSVFEVEVPDRTAVNHAVQKIRMAADAALDPLETDRDSLIRSFGDSLASAASSFFSAVETNSAEQRRYKRQKAAYDRKVARGHAPEGQIAPLALVDLQLQRKQILALLDDMILHLKRLSEEPSSDGKAQTRALMQTLRGYALGEVHKITRAAAKDRAIRLMQSVGISDARKRYHQYPFEFSGGMRQRIVIAIALTANPDVLICDEPTTALDVTIQAQILELINRLKRERRLSVIFITHDLGVVANMADRIAVMYAGKLVEVGTANEVFYEPAHPYTWALLSSVPDLNTNERLESIPGTPPNMIYPPVGDAFAERSRYAMQIDFEAQPPMFAITETHSAATWLLHPDAPKVEPPQIVQDRIARMTAGRKETDHA